MNEDLLNVIGNFIEIELDYVKKLNEESIIMQQEINQLKKQQKDFITFIEEEKNRLVKATSHIYEDSLGKTMFVNEDIFNEINVILNVFKEITGVDIK